MQWISDAVSSLFSEYPSQQQKPAQQTGSGEMVPKEILVHVFQQTSLLLDKAEVKAQLRAAAQQGQDPDDLVTEMQRRLFEAQGVAGACGIECLGRIGDVYQDDADFMRVFEAFVQREEEAVNEASMSPEQLQLMQTMNTEREQLQQQLLKLQADTSGKSIEEQQRLLAAFQQRQLEALPEDVRQRAMEHMQQQAHACGPGCSHTHQQHSGMPMSDGIMTPEETEAFLKATRQTS